MNDVLLRELHKISSVAHYLGDNYEMNEIEKDGYCHAMAEIRKLLDRYALDKQQVGRR